MNNSSYQFKHTTRALPKYGAERIALIAELWQEESMLTHLIISSQAHRAGGAWKTEADVDPYKQEAADCSQRIAEIVVRLNEITKAK